MIHGEDFTGTYLEKELPSLFGKVSDGKILTRKRSGVNTQQQYSSPQSSTSSNTTNSYSKSKSKSKSKTTLPQKKYKSTSKTVDVFTPNYSRVPTKFKVSKKKVDTDIKGERVENIVGIKSINNDKYFLVKWVNKDILSLVHSKLLSTIKPQKVIDFYEKWIDIPDILFPPPLIPPPS